MCAAGRERVLGAQRSNSRSYCEYLQRRRLPDGADAHGAVIRAEGSRARALLEQHDDLAGIYNIGGGAEGIGRALKEAGADRKIVFIGHGLTPDTRALLIDGRMDAVITQNPQGAVMNCVRIFANLQDGREPTSGVETTRSHVIFRENLP